MDHGAIAELHNVLLPIAIEKLQLLRLQGNVMT